MTSNRCSHVPVDSIVQGDCLEVMRRWPAGQIQTCVTSPPYWGLRDYGVDGQLGLEETPEEYVAKMVEVFREVRRVLRDDGTLWLNLGDSYAMSSVRGPGPIKNFTRGASNVKDNMKAWESGIDRKFNSVKASGLKPKDLVGIPWMVAFALRADGWYLRSDIIWSKPNPMPESVTDRPTKAHEYLFLLSKNGGNPLLWRAIDTNEWSYKPDLDEIIVINGKECKRWRGCDYYYDADAIAEPLAESSVQRLAQDVESQAGSNRAHDGDKTNGPMKAVSRRDSFKRSGPVADHVLPNQGAAQHRADREDTPPNGTRNKRSVWTVAT